MSSSTDYKNNNSSAATSNTLKKPYLQYSRSETEIEYLREVKKVFDPNNIMNRGKIFDM